MQQFNQIIIIMEENMIVIKHLKTFYFNFDWHNNFDDSSYEIEFIIKNNESLALSGIKNEIEQLLFTYKHWNNIYEREKQQNKWTT